MSKSLEKAKIIFFYLAQKIIIVGKYTYFLSNQLNQQI